MHQWNAYYFYSLDDSFYSLTTVCRETELKSRHQAISALEKDVNVKEKLLSNIETAIIWIYRFSL